MSGKIADNDWPMGVIWDVHVNIVIMVENRNGVTGEDHRHGQGDCQPYTAFASAYVVAGSDIFTHLVSSLLHAGDIPA